MGVGNQAFLVVLSKESDFHEFAVFFFSQSVMMKGWLPAADAPHRWAGVLVCHSYFLIILCSQF